MFNRYSAVVLCYIVDTTEYDDVPWVQANHILSEAYQQFRGSLSTYTTSDETMGQEEIRTHLIPIVRNAVAVEDGSHLCFLFFKFHVGLRIFSELRPIAMAFVVFIFGFKHVARMELREEIKYDALNESPLRELP